MSDNINTSTPQDDDNEEFDYELFEQENRFWAFMNERFEDEIWWQRDEDEE